MVLATQLVDFDRPIDQALRMPRFLLGRSFFDSTDNLKLEADIDPAVVANLQAMGHEVEIIPSLSPYTGQAGAIAIETDGRRFAMHDPRGQGNSLGQGPVEADPS